MTEPDKPHEPKSAQERLDLGRSYYNEGKFDEAITAWSNIYREDDPKTYARAQLNLGNAYYTRGKLDDAITAWSNIHREDDPKTYARAQFNLGLAYQDQGNLDKAKEAYRNARDFLYYKGERRYRILECPQEVIEKLHDIAKSTDKVLKSLQIIPEYESKVAHYSRPSTAFPYLETRKTIRIRQISDSVPFVESTTRRKG